MNSSSIQISEIYKSLQGESTLAGLPTIFVRTTGCPVRCVYCDTAYAFHGGSKFSIKDVLDQVKDLNCSRVCITGGEPLAQRTTLELIESLLRHNFDVSLETSGVRSIEDVPRPCKVVLDVKTPDSGVYDAWLPENLNQLQAGDELKTVIVSETDWHWWLEWYLSQKTAVPDGVAWLLSPCTPTVSADQLSQWMLAANDMDHVRLNLQVHKFIWPADDRGR